MMFPQCIACIYLLLLILIAIVIGYLAYKDIKVQ